LDLVVGYSSFLDWHFENLFYRFGVGQRPTSTQDLSAASFDTLQLTLRELSLHEAMHKPPESPSHRRDPR
jgi:hypothetical protein